MNFSRPCVIIKHDPIYKEYLMKKPEKILIILLILFIAFFAAGCGGDTGSVTLKITDAPIDDTDVKSVVITVTEISFHMSYMDESEEWVVVEDFDGPKEFDLLALTNGVTDMLGQFEFPAGKVTQMRFKVDAPETSGSPVNPGCYVILADDSEYPLFIPSGSTSGFKATGAFDVPVNDTVAVTADFDVRKSIRYTNGDYNLQPTVRVIADGEAGRIAGDVTYSGTDTVLVYAYQDGDYSTSELSTDPMFLNAVSSAIVTDGSYVLPFLAAGAYDLVSAVFDADGTYIDSSVDEEGSVTIASGKTGRLNITVE